MERRKRVQMVMGSRQFRSEMERIIGDQIREGMAPASMAALQQLYDLGGARGGLVGGFLAWRDNLRCAGKAPSNHSPSPIPKDWTGVNQRRVPAV